MAAEKAASGDVGLLWSPFVSTMDLSLVYEEL